jgi:hypothetical protein
MLLELPMITSPVPTHSFTGAYSPGHAFGLPFRGFLITHIQTHGRTNMDE